MKKRILVVAAVVIYGTLHGQNETANKSLDEVIVTASRKEQKQSQTGKVVTVIDQAALQNNKGKLLTEILNQYAGIFTVGANNAPGSNQELYFRGAATGNTLVLIDGIPLQDPSQITNTYDLNNIHPDNIERIEILKGAQSTLWGSNAVAGVINIITKKGGPKAITPAAGIAYGSYNTLRLNAGLSGDVKKLTYNLSYNRLSTDGFSAAYDSTDTKDFDKDGLKQNSFRAQLGYRVSDHFSINISSNYSNYKAATDASAYKDDEDAIAKSKNFVNSLHLNYKSEKTNIHLLQSVINSNRNYLNDSSDASNWSDANYEGRSYVTDLYGNYKLAKRSALVAGLQYVYQKTEQSFSSISSYGPYNTMLGSDSAKTNHFAAYASYLLTGWQGINLELGGRFNQHSIYGNNTTFTLNPSYNIDEQTRVFINISSGFNVPSLYQLYSEYGNKELKPEQSINYEIGVQSLTNDKQNSLRIVAFKRDVKNLIVYYSDPKTYEAKYINRDQQKDYGFEIESNIAFGSWGKWRSNFTYINGEGINDGIKIRNFYRRPRFSVNTALTIKPTKNLTMVPAFRFVGERIPGNYDLGGPSPMPHYYTIDFYTSYLIMNSATLFLDIRNVTNQKYFDVYGYNSRKFNFMAGLNLSF